MRSFRWLMPFLILAFVLPAGVSFASDARLDALGIQREYVEDYFNFRVFPTVAARYQNLVTASLGSADANSGQTFGNHSVGVIGAGDNTSYGVFAVYLNQAATYDRFFVRDEQDNAIPSEMSDIDLTWAKNFSKVTTGLSLRWTDSSVKQGDAESKPLTRGITGGGTNSLSVTGGLKFDVGTTDNVELAVDLTSITWMLTNSAGDVITEDAGNLSYRLSARMMNQMSKGNMLVPVVIYQHLDATAQGDADDTYSNRLNVGAALQHEVNGNDLLIMGLAANYLKRKTYTGAEMSAEFSRWDLPAMFIALEFDVYPWLTGRVGATKTVDISKVNAPGDNVPDRDTLSSRYFFGFGMGLHFEHFDVDATVNPDAVFTGGYLFSGKSAYPLTSITGTYYF